MLFKETYTGLRLREFKHRFTYRHIYNRMQQAHERYRECAFKKSSCQIKSETDVCKKFWHCYPLYYLRYNLYRRNVLLSDDALRDYIPEFFFYSIFLPFHDS